MKITDQKSQKSEEVQMKEAKKKKKNQANKPWLQILLPGLIHWWKCCDVSKGQDTGKFV